MTSDLEYMRWDGIVDLIEYWNEIVIDSICTHAHEPLSPGWVGLAIECKSQLQQFQWSGMGH